MASDWRPRADARALRERARVYHQIRAFFAARDVLEVDTPLLATSTNTDRNITSIEIADPARPCFLQTSPEFAMKRLIAAGSGSIYQICHAFRAAESGRKHNPEFSLLEWYRIGFDYQQLMDEMEILIDCLSSRENQFQRLSYADLLLEHTGIDIARTELGALRQKAQALLPHADTSALDFDQCLDLLIGFAVGPQLQGYVFVYDYPVSQAALARVSASDPGVAERFELYYEGLELANGFSELTDANLQRARFEADNRERQAAGLPQYPIDQQLLAALDAGLPECAGVALGLDRLLMVLLGYDRIEQVLSFCETRV